MSKHWHTYEDDQHILWLRFDRNDTSANVINIEVLNELEEIIEGLQASPFICGVVIESEKPAGFCPGADLHYINAQLVAQKDILDFIDKGRNVFAKLAGLSIPTLAMISGTCMGGGLEMALACRYRVAASDQKTRLGLPEVQLGIVPAWGGIQRLPQLIGAPQGLAMILSGRAASARRAKKIGLVDLLVPQRQLKRAAIQTILKKPPKHKRSALQSFMEIKPMRMLLASVMRKQVAKKVQREHYPAPYLMIDQWACYGSDNLKLQMASADDIKQLLAEGGTARNLLRIFLLREQLQAAGKQSDFKARHVHVIGAGTMGGDIAAWCALQGLHVTLQDQTPESLCGAIKRAHKLYKKKLKDRAAIRDAMDCLIPDVAGDGVARADVIIEAVFEDVKVKQDLFEQLEQSAKSDAILATNTSSIPLDEINTVMRDPSRLLGIHFFNPVDKMLLVEIICGDQTDQAQIQKANGFIHQLKRLPVNVKSCPGFLVNRLLMPYLLESVRLLEEGNAARAIDKAATDFGMAMGPIELADRVGLDVCLAVANHLAPHFKHEQIPEELMQMVEKKKLGVKTGSGFYDYKNGHVCSKMNAAASAQASQLMAERLIFRIINEAAACMREDIVANGDLLDAAMIFGTGFAPFRGGPVHYIQSQGKQQIRTTFAALEKQFGERYKADPYFY